MRDRLLRQRVDEARGHEDDLVHLALQEQIARHGGDRPGLGESRRIPIRKIGDELAACARDELRGLATGRDEDGRTMIVPSDQSKQIAVERSAQTLVRRHEDDQALLDRAHVEQGMREVGHARHGPCAGCDTPGG